MSEKNDADDSFSWTDLLKNLNEQFNAGMLKAILLALLQEMNQNTEIGVSMKGVKIIKTYVEGGYSDLGSRYTVLKEQEIFEGDGFEDGDTVFLIAINKKNFSNIINRLIESGAFDSEKKQ